MRYSVMLGAKFDFAETSSGVVIYAYSPRELRDQCDAWLKADRRPREEIEQVAARAAKILRTGCEVQKSLAVEGVTNISAPVFDHLGHVIAALTVPYIPQRAATIPLQKVRDLTIEAGRAISVNLGAGTREPLTTRATGKRA
jgi:DNA-binding IclR family transcriptional regulator